VGESIDEWQREGRLPRVGRVSMYVSGMVSTAGNSHSCPIFVFGTRYGCGSRSERPTGPSFGSRPGRIADPALDPWGYLQPALGDTEAGRAELAAALAINPLQHAMGAVRAPGPRWRRHGAMKDRA